MTLYIIIGVLVIIGILIYLYNSIIASKNNLEEAKSSIETFLQQRYDLIPNLVEVVKQYMKHEREVLQKVTELRSSLLNQKGDFSKQRLENENMLTSALKSIFAISENYPDLKANNNFIALQNQWAEIEDNISAARRAYNAALKDLNNKKQMFPYNIIASFIPLPEDYSYFEAAPQAHKNISAKELFNS